MGRARQALLFSELLWNIKYSAAFPLDFFTLGGLFCRSVLNQFVSGVLKRAIARRAVTCDANEYVAVEVAVVGRIIRSATVVVAAPKHQHY